MLLKFIMTCYDVYNRVLKMIDEALVPRWVQLGFSNNVVGSKRPHCMDVADAMLPGRISERNVPLSMGNLVGPFLMLLVGYTFAIWVFVFEKILYLLRNGCLFKINKSVV